MFGRKERDLGDYSENISNSIEVLIPGTPYAIRPHHKRELIIIKLGVPGIGVILKCLLVNSPRAVAQMPFLQSHGANRQKHILARSGTKKKSYFLPIKARLPHSLRSLAMTYYRTKYPVSI